MLVCRWLRGCHGVVCGARRALIDDAPFTAIVASLLARCDRTLCWPAYQPTAAAAAADRSFAASPPARKKTLKMYKTWDKNCETCERARQPNSMTLKENRRVKKCRQGKQFTWGIQTRVPCVKHYTQINNNMNNNTQIAKVRDKDITCLTMKSEKGDYRNVHHRSQ